LLIKKNYSPVEKAALLIKGAERKAKRAACIFKNINWRFLKN